LCPRHIGPGLFGLAKSLPVGHLRWAISMWWHGDNPANKSGEP